MAEYKVNGNRAAEIRQSTFGKETREPIARSAEFMVEYAENGVTYYGGNTKYIDYVNNAKVNDLASINNMRPGIFRELNEFSQEKRRELNAMKVEHNALIKPIDTKCATRVASMTVTPIAGEDGYFALSFTRENGK